ncbi:MAG: dihydrolipoamide acetyltransferase family protein [Deltaproteobacteria bacterium]|nr:dihydrolipoamide acetyltransferase family protein [Deltaproteobacteria bacterium]
MDVTLPKLAEGADSGTVVNILVVEGDPVQVDQTLLELENEKAVAPIPSTGNGRVARVHVDVGQVVSVGQVLVTIDEDRAARAPAAPAPSPAAEPAAPTTPAAPPEVPQEAQVHISGSGAPPAASPTVRKIARELGIDLTRVKGSQRGGRIVMADVRGYIQGLQQLALKPAAPAAEPVVDVFQTLDLTKWGPAKRERMSPLRRTIAQRMTESWTTVPHVTQFDDADITGLMELRKRYAKAYEKAGARLTVTSFAIKAAVSALDKYPAFKTSVDYQALEIVTRDYVHIGVAVDTEAGLIAPVIRDADKKDLLSLSVELDELAERTRQRKLSADEMQGATFTISNLGSIGGSYFTPIVNSPQVAVLGMGRGVQRPMVRDKKVALRMVLPLALSYDHRVIDGADGARFLREIVRCLEDYPEAEIKWPVS